MIDYRFVPLTVWPGKATANRKRSTFRAGYTATLKLLRTELGLLAAKNVVVQIALDQRDIRLDGMPRADAKAPRHPGVILSFDSKHGPLSYPCDRFDAWEDNLRAIALSLEHLRAVDRYGVTKRGEQYQGWASLPPPSTKHDSSWAWSVLASLSGAPVSECKADPKAAYRKAAMDHHPDRGGDAELFKGLQEAKNFLGI